MLPLNIGLPKTPPGLILDRCHEPCPSVIPNTDQSRLNQDLQVLTQCYPNTSPIKTLESQPSVTPTLVQSRLLLSGVCHKGEAKAASPDGSLHQS